MNEYPQSQIQPRRINIEFSIFCDEFYKLTQKQDPTCVKCIRYTRMAWYFNQGISVDKAVERFIDTCYNSKIVADN